MALRLKYLVLGDDPGLLSEIKIEGSETVASLKKEIWREDQSKFKNISAKYLRLWRVDIPEDDDYALASPNLSQGQELTRQGMKLSKIFQDLDEDNCHVIVAPPEKDVAPLEAPSGTLSLWCLVFGDDPELHFKITIHSSADVADLKKEIWKENQNMFKSFDAKYLRLWRVSLPFDDPDGFKQLKLKDDEELKTPSQLLSDLFPNPAQQHCHIVIKSYTTNKQVGTQEVSMSVEGRIATLKSWDEVFIGDAHHIFYESAKKQCREDNNYYARYQSIVQSSGMGKSRMIDELSKEYLVIPINLRRTGTGFPPGDKEVPGFLTLDPFVQAEAYMRCHAFLISLFTVTRKVLVDITSTIKNLSPEDRMKMMASQFREYMRAEQRFEGHGPNRVEFYADVIKCANELLEREVKVVSDKQRTASKSDEPPSPSTGITFGDASSGGLETTLFELLNLLDPNLPTNDDILMKVPPMLFLAFDEAQELSSSAASNSDKDGSPVATPFSELRRALRQIIDFPVFSVMLSTTGNVKDFTPPPMIDPSGRLSKQTLHLFPPFTELGFDQMIKADNFTIVPNKWDIDFVSTVEFMSRFGRPLFGSRMKNASKKEQREILPFAASKLCATNYDSWRNTVPSPEAQLSLLSVRLALEFNPISTQIKARELEQVEKYMRVCILIRDGFETAVTLSPSEPILAEASRYVMTKNPSFNVPLCLSDRLVSLGLDKGDRGELVAKLLLILASDMAYEQKERTMSNLPNTDWNQNTVPRSVTLEAFFSKLLAEQWHTTVNESSPAEWRTETEANRSFGTTFGDSKVYFNHFLKIDDPEVINRRFLWKLISRGAAVMCANNQKGVDLVIPFVFSGRKLSRKATSAIFVQVKNDASFRTKPDTVLFDLMNPHRESVNFFGRNGDEREDEPLPVIRMVFALASEKSAVKVVQQGKEGPMREAKAEASKGAIRYTSYDIWCAGASSETFGVIKGGVDGDHHTYRKLLKLHSIFPNAYTDEVNLKHEAVSHQRRTMNPGSAKRDHHWGEFCDDSVEEEGEVVDSDGGLGPELHSEEYQRTNDAS